MKEDIIKKLQRLADRDFTDAAWLARTKHLLLAYMSAHPHQPRASLASWLSSRIFVRAATVMAVFALMLVGVAGVTFASQESIPGDALYSWKVSVENIQSVFLVSTQNRAEFEVQRTTKRLKEVTELAVRKETNHAIVEEATIRLETQIKVASEKIAEAAVENKDKALESAVALGAALQAHEQVLHTVETKVDVDVKPQVHDALSTIQKSSTDVQGAIEDLKTQTKEEATTEAKLSQQLADTQIKIDTVWDSVVKLDENTDVRLKSEVNIKFAQDALDNAQKSIEAEAYADAMIEIQLAQQLASDTEAHLEATENSGETIKQILVPTPSSTPPPTASPSRSTTPAPTVNASPSQSPTSTPIASVAPTIEL